MCASSLLTQVLTTCFDHKIAFWVSCFKCFFFLSYLCLQKTFRCLCPREERSPSLYPIKNSGILPVWCSHMTHRVGSVSKPRVTSWVCWWLLCRYGRNFFFFPSFKASCFGVEVSLSNLLFQTENDCYCLMKY